MTDPIADMLTRLRNAVASRRTEVSLPYSKMKEAIAKILQDNGFIAGFKVDTDGPFKRLQLQLPADGQTVITEIHRLSKPGRRVYAGSNDIPRVLGGRGIVIISTSGGIMTGHEAKRRGLGGELICRVW